MLPNCSRKMPAQSTSNLTVQGRDGNPRLVIHNPLDGLPELGDSSVIRGNAPADTKRLVKNVFDAYGVGKQGSFANSIGESVRLVEVRVNGHDHQRLEPVEPKERLEASTTAELTVSQGTSRLIMGPPPLHACGNCRDAERSGNLTRRMYCLPDRHVGYTCQSFLGDDRDLDLCFNSCCSTPLVALGHVQGKDGLGVTQNLNITYHAPVSLCVFSPLTSTPFLCFTSRHPAFR